MHKLRNLHLLGMLAAATATAAFAQTGAPGGPHRPTARLKASFLSCPASGLTSLGLTSNPRRRALARSGTWRAGTVSATCTNWWAIILIRS